MKKFYENYLIPSERSNMRRVDTPEREERGTRRNIIPIFDVPSLLEGMCEGEIGAGKPAPRLKVLLVGLN